MTSQFQRVFAHFASQNPPRTLLGHLRVASSISYRFGKDFGPEINAFSMNFGAVCGSDFVAQKIIYKYIYIYIYIYIYLCRYIHMYNELTTEMKVPSS
jgi:hypothetical protein